MGQHIYHSVDIKGQDNLDIAKLELKQSIFGHHEFTLELNTEYSGQNTSQFESAVAMIGSEVVIEFQSAYFSDVKSSFKGVITKAGLKENDSSTSTIIVRGCSPTILLDGLQNTKTYLKSSLKDIFDELLANQPNNLLGRKSNSQQTSKVPFLFQFNESDYNFLARQANDHGEWLFYDGNLLLLGLPSGRDEHELKVGLDVWNLELNMQTKPLKQTVSGYAYDRDAVDKQDLSSLISAKDHNDKAKSKSNNIFTAKAIGPAMYASESTKDSESSAKVTANSSIADLMTISGYTSHTGLKIGDIIEVFSNSETYGKFSIIKLHHTLDGANSYENYFSAIPLSAEIPPVNNTIVFPTAYPMFGKVIENKDPKKQGRIKVQFAWISDDLKTDWIRVVHSAAGSGYGNYFVPEVGDQVIVDFEYGNADLPYANGSLFHSGNEPTDMYHDKNYLKVIKTKAGNQIQINDEGGKEKIEISTPGQKHTIVLDAGAKKIEITSLGDIMVSGTNITLSASKKLELSCDEFALNATKSAAMDSMEVKVTGSNSLNLEGQIEANLKGAQTTVDGQGMLTVKSSGITQINGSMVKIN